MESILGLAAVWLEFAAASQRARNGWDFGLPRFDWLKNNHFLRRNHIFYSVFFLSSKQIILVRSNFCFALGLGQRRAKKRARPDPSPNSRTVVAQAAQAASPARNATGMRDSKKIDEFMDDFLADSDSCSGSPVKRLALSGGDSHTGPPLRHDLVAQLHKIYKKNGGVDRHWVENWHRKDPTYKTQAKPTKAEIAAAKKPPPTAKTGSHDLRGPNFVKKLRKAKPSKSKDVTVPNVIDVEMLDSQASSSNAPLPNTIGSNTVGWSQNEKNYITNNDFQLDFIQKLKIKIVFNCCFESPEIFPKKSF